MCWNSFRGFCDYSGFKVYFNKVYINFIFKVVNNSDKLLCKVFFVVVIVILESFVYIKVSKGLIWYV